MTTESSFRGYHSIEEVVERLKPLAEWTARFRPDQKHLRLKRKDFDLIRRWPKAAKYFSLHVESESTKYLTKDWSFELYPDTGPGRYEPRHKPEQAVIQ